MKNTTIVILAAVAGFAGCGGDSTTGRQVVLQTRLTSDLGPDRSFTTGLGWAVTLDRALIATGPLYLFDGEPAFVLRRPAANRWRTLRAALSPLGTAHAHPGHYLAGNAKGQMLQPFSADLLAGATMLPAGDGLTGLVRSATFSFAAPGAGPASARLAGQVALVSGVARKDGQTVHFQLGADLADIAKMQKDALIVGCVFDEAEVEGPGVVTVTVKPRVWFNLLDFTQVAPGTEAAPTVVAPGSVAHIAFAQGLGQLSAYHFTFTPNQGNDR
jgi:hypothetical protein